MWRWGMRTRGGGGGAAAAPAAPGLGILVSGEGRKRGGKGGSE